ncbi:UNVERIFIED_CONTAM: hypothetical protein FKN15_050206 [Acipenser sinensis]
MLRHSRVSAGVVAVVALSKRSKEAEAAFLGVYKQFIEAPDPSPVLEAAHSLEERLQQLQSSDPESRALKEISRHWRRHLEHHSSQVETEERLVAEPSKPHPNRKALRAGETQLLNNESKKEKYVSSRKTGQDSDQNGFTAPHFHSRPSALSKTHSQGHEDIFTVCVCVLVRRGIEEAQISLAARLGEAEEKIKVLHSGLAEILYFSNCLENKPALYVMCCRAEEVGLIMTNLEKANQRTETAQREVESLREQLATANSAVHLGCHTAEEARGQDKRESRCSGSRLEAALAAKDREIIQLLKDVQRLQITLQELQKSSANQIAGMERQLAYKTAAIEDTSKAAEGLQLDKEAFLPSQKYLLEKTSLLHSNEEDHSEEESLKDSLGTSLSYLSPLRPPQPLQDGPPSPGSGPPLLTPDLPRPFSVSPFSRDKLPVDSLLQKKLLPPLYKKDSVSLMAFPTALYAAKAALVSANQSQAIASGEAGPPSDQSESGSSSAGDEEHLETTEIAYQVKEQLLKHNIGQPYLKRRYGLLSTGSDSDSPSARSDCVSPCLAPGDFGHFSQSKKARVVLAAEEKEALKKAYLLEPYPSQHTIELLGSQLSLKTNTVINWFHNYRSRMRREVLLEGYQDNDTDPESSSYGGCYPHSTPTPHSPASDTEDRKPAVFHSRSEGCSLHGETLVKVKQEAPDNCEGEEEEEEQVSTAVNFPCLLKNEEEAGDCHKSLREDGALCKTPLGTQGSLPEPGQSVSRQESEEKLVSDPVSFKAASEPSRGSLEVSLNSPSAASSPGLVMSVSPVPSSSAPISPSPSSSDPLPPENPKSNKNTQRRNEKMANLNNIIHRLERAANREETLEWEF